MSVQIKAKHTIYQLFVKFIMQNMEWEIDEYDKSKDSLYKPSSLVWYMLGHVQGMEKTGTPIGYKAFTRNTNWLCVGLTTSSTGAYED